jgi:hypothetical protein
MTPKKQLIEICAVCTFVVLPCVVFLEYLNSTGFVYFKSVLV